MLKLKLSAEEKNEQDRMLDNAYNELQAKPFRGSRADPLFAFVGGLLYTAALVALIVITGAGIHVFLRSLMVA